MVLGISKHNDVYTAIQEYSQKEGNSVELLCDVAGVSRASYYKWLHRKKKKTEAENEMIIPFIIQAYEERDGILGYRQMTIKLRRETGMALNRKRIYRLMRVLGLKSVCRRKKRHYIKTIPEITADNILNREFQADNVCKKWLTDVTEFKYGTDRKAYLSAILDLGDRSIVSFVLGHSNNNDLVFKTFDLAVEKYPEAHPVFHSDRGFQYTSKTFKRKLDEVCMTQSMSRISRCIDNGPMEGFWGILKVEMYYLRKFDTYEELESAVIKYIDYYNYYRYQKRLSCMTPMEYRKHLQGGVA